MTGPASRPVTRRSNHDPHRLRLPIGAAPPDQVYAAFVDPDRLLAWLPPERMTGRFEHFDARPEGSYRLVLTYADASGPSIGRGDRRY